MNTVRSRPTRSPDNLLSGFVPPRDEQEAIPGSPRTPHCFARAPALNPDHRERAGNPACTPRNSCALAWHSPRLLVCHLSRRRFVRADSRKRQPVHHHHASLFFLGSDGPGRACDICFSFLGYGQSADSPKLSFSIASTRCDCVLNAALDFDVARRLYKLAKRHPRLITRHVTGQPRPRPQ